MLVGGTFGVLKGLQKGGATSKLRVNAVMNAMSTQGPALANQAAIISNTHAYYYYCIPYSQQCIMWHSMGWYHGLVVEEMTNSMLLGLGLSVEHYSKPLVVVG